MSKKRRYNGEGSITERWTARINIKGKRKTVSANSRKKVIEKIKAAGSDTDSTSINHYWQGQIVIGRNPDTGRMKRKSVYGKTQKEVIEELDRIKGRVKNNTYSEPGKITIGEWLRSWLEEHKKNVLKQTTYESYELIVEKYIIPSIGHVLMKELKTSHLQSLYNELLKSGRKNPVPGKGGKGLSARTVKYVHTIIHGALKQAVKERVVYINPAEAVTLPKQEKKEMKFLDSEGIKRFLKTAANSRHYAAYYLDLSAGLRRGELLGLRWCDIDFKKGTVHVRQQLVRTTTGKHLIQGLKSKLSKRDVAIGDDAIAVMKSHKQVQTQYLKERLGYDDIRIAKHFKDGLVFISLTGGIIQPRNFVRDYKETLKRAGLPDIRVHDLRHSFAVMTLEAGGDIKSLQSDLGHHSAAFTLDVYGHVSRAMKRESANKRSEFLKACTKE